MNFVQLKYVGMTGAVFTNNQVYDVLGWAADGSNEALAVVLGADNEFYCVDANNSSDWNTETVTVIRPTQLYP